MRRLVVNSMRADSIRRSSARYLRPPRMLWMAPVDPFEQITELPGRDHHHAIVRRWPDKASLLQALGVERGTQSVVPEDLDQLAALAAEDVKIAGMRIAPQSFLDL